MVLLQYCKAMTISFYSVRSEFDYSIKCELRLSVEESLGGFVSADD